MLVSVPLTIFPCLSELLIVYSVMPHRFTVAAFSVCLEWLLWLLYLNHWYDIYLWVGREPNQGKTQQICLCQLRTTDWGKTASIITWECQLIWLWEHSWRTWADISSSIRDCCATCWESLLSFSEYCVYSFFSDCIEALAVKLLEVFFPSWENSWDLNPKF